ncbi:MAG: Hemolysin, plasmid, partial [Nitrospirota bacterium]
MSALHNDVSIGVLGTGTGINVVFDSAAYPRTEDWVQFAFVYQNTGSGSLLSIYRNGDLIKYGDVSRNSVDPSVHFLIGRISNYLNSAFEGVLDDVRIYSSALSEREIKSLFQIESTEPINRAPTLDPLADVKLVQNPPSQTVNLSGIGSGAVDEVQGLTVTATSDNPALIANPKVTYTSPNATGTLTYQPVVGATGKATITVTVKDDGGVRNGGQDTFSRQFAVMVLPNNPCLDLDLTNGLVAYYPFNGNASDESGSSEPPNAAEPSNHKFDGNLTFTDINGTVAFDSSWLEKPSWAVPDDQLEFTFSFWFNQTNYPAAGNFSWQIDNSSFGRGFGPEGFRIYSLRNQINDVLTVNKIRFGVGNEWQINNLQPNQGWSWIETEISDQQEGWHHIVATYSAKGVQTLYVDGVVIGRLAGVKLSRIDNPDGNNLSLGGRNGVQISEVRYYSKALTDCEVNELHKLETKQQINRAPTLNALADVKLLQNSPSQTVNLSGIGSGAVDEVQVLTVIATSDNPALISNPMMTYTSPNATGTLTYQPVVGATGKATITVTVKDDGGVLNGGQDTFSRQFTVTVSPINRAPTLNALAEMKLLQNAPSQTVNLSGIGSGAVDEVQGLAVTATSDNPALIANPKVTYTSPNATGTLTYQPIVGATGKATITVTVKDDGGVLNGGQDTFSRQFTVTVSPINRAPTLNALADVKLLQNA